MRGGMATWLLLLFASFSPTASEAVEAPAHRSLEVRLLGAASPDTGPVNPAVDTATSGALGRLSCIYVALQPNPFLHIHT